jgi:Secretion system C-terminal sorting domain
MKHHFILQWVRQKLPGGVCAGLFFLLMAGLPFNKAFAQSNIEYAEYYLDQDPGLNLAIPIPITPAVDIINVAVNIDVNALTRGVHIFGTRSRTASGIWGMSHYWFLFKPYIAITPAALSNIIRVEYYVDQDPGIGSGISAGIAPGTNLSNITFSIDPVPLSLGVHIIGSRALNADGSWSKTNFWLFYKPYPNIPTPGTPANMNYVEYYVDQDPGIGNATQVSVIPGLDLSDINLPVNISGLSNGLHIIGARGKDAAGNWSKTNFWLFARPYANITGPSLVNTTAMEYYLDYDPGYGNGIPVPFAPGTNMADFTFNVDVSAIIPGNHFVIVRARDANNNWSMVNSWPFNIPGTPPVLSTLVSTTTLCAGAPINVGYQLSTPVSYNPGNTFIAQLSNSSGSFVSPVVIGTTASTANSGAFSCVIPANTTGGSSYRIRVISTSQPIVGTDNGTNMTIYALPVVPVITSPLADTTICQTNTLTLTATNVGFSPQWLLNGNPIPGATSFTYTVASTGLANAGAYSLRVTSTNPCNVVSSVINIAINTNVPATPTITPNGAVGICLGSTKTLTSSAAANNQWYNSGLLIPGATAQTLVVSTPGTYTVRVSNGTCTVQSSNSAVVSIGIPPTTPIVTTGGPTTFCQGGGVNLTSSAFSGNQWLKNNVAIAGAISTSYFATASGYYKVMVSAASCDVFSDSVLVTVNPTLTPSVTVAASTNNVPAGTSITITATPVNGGAGPLYNFYLNGVSVQNGASNTYTSTTFASGNTVFCNLTSNVACASTTSVNSNTVTITLLNPVTVIGRISNPTGLIIPTVNVRISGGTIDSTLTDAQGNYSFSLLQQRNYTIAPNKNNDVVKSSGVNVLDVLQVQAHILGSTLLNNAYKVIAADVNTDNAVNIFDLVLIKRLILGIDTTFPGFRLWAFVDSTQTFGNPNNPFPYASSKSYTNLSANQIKQSFIGIKLGDVTQDWAPVPGQNTPVTYHAPLQLFYDTVYADNIDIFRVRVRVRDFNELAGLQFTMGFNEQKLQFTGIENKFITVEHNEKNAGKGLLSFIWADPANHPKTLPDGTVLFDLVFRKIQDFIKEDIFINRAYSASIAFTGLFEPLDIIKAEGAILYRPKQVMPAVLTEVMEINPNPTHGLINVNIASKTLKKVVLVVTDIFGRQVMQKILELGIGNNNMQVNLRQNRFLSAGMYYLKAKGLEDEEVKKVLLLNE